MTQREKEAAVRLRRLHLDGKIELREGFERKFIGDLASEAVAGPGVTLSGAQRVQLWRIVQERVVIRGRSGTRQGTHDAELEGWAREELLREAQGVGSQGKLPLTIE
jgi:hypothetical protein